MSSLVFPLDRGSIDAAPHPRLCWPLPSVPSPLAQRAAAEVMEGLRTGEVAPGISTRSALHGPRGGKMFGVLVVRSGEGGLGYLKAFSGQLERRWDVPGWIPPVFDRQERARVEVEVDRETRALGARVSEARSSPELKELELRLTALRLRHDAEDRALLETQAARRADRAARRETSADAVLADAAREALALESRADHVALRQARAQARLEREELEQQRGQLYARATALAEEHLQLSRAASWRLYETYRFQSARGVKRSLRELFAPRTPSAGTGDCAAPKLLVHALRQGLEPLALAEFWWGAPTPGTGRTEGAFFPPCPEKCEPLLAFLLDDAAAPAPDREGAPSAREDRLEGRAPPLPFPRDEAVAVAPIRRDPDRSRTR